MTVADLIKYLQKQPQNLPVVFSVGDQQAMAQLDCLGIEDMCYPDRDGFIADERPFAKTRPCLVLGF